MQAAIGYPLTVHGTGGQTRAFINIGDTVRCIQLAIENPPEVGERVRVFNQMTECHRVIDLARTVAELTGVEIDHVENPRNEAESNELLVENRQLLDLGLDPITLQRGLLEEVTEIAASTPKTPTSTRFPAGRCGGPRLQRAVTRARTSSRWVCHRHTQPTGGVRCRRSASLRPRNPSRESIVGIHRGNPSCCVT